MRPPVPGKSGVRNGGERKVVPALCGIVRPVLANVPNRILHRFDLLGRVVGNVDAELILQRHNQLDDFERVGADVIGERAGQGDQIRGNPGLAAQAVAEPPEQMATTFSAPIAARIGSLDGRRVAAHGTDVRLAFRRA